ncbi:family 2 glycosyl transferase, partial [Streptomyces sp. NPDC054844]
AEAGAGGEPVTEAADASAQAGPPAEAPVAVPQQPAYSEWDSAGYAGAEYNSYGTYGGEQYQGAQQYDPGAYGQQQYPADAYQGGQAGQYEAGQYEAGQQEAGQHGQYDPYAYGDPSQGATYDQAYGQAGYDTPYDPSQPHHPHSTGSERPDGSQQ